MTYKNILLSILVGFAVGLATVFGQKYLPGTLNSIANSGSVWVIPAFYIGVKQKDKLQAILFSITYLIICVMTYYGYYNIVWNTGFSIGFHQAVWLICAVVFGMLFGLGGYLSKNGTNKINYLCKTMLPAAFLSESLNFIVNFNNYGHMIDVIIMWLIVGIIIYFINCKNDWKSKQCLYALIIMTLLGLIGYQLIYYSDRLIL